MIRTLRAELIKLLRRRVLAVATVTTVVFAVGAATIVLASAEPAGTVPQGRGVTIESLAEAGGGTDVFRTAASFAGFFLFVVFVGAVAVDFSRGTVRTMLLRQSGRLRLLAGKMAALLAFAAAVLAVTEAITWVAARLIAPSRGVSTEDWVSVAALGQGLADLGAVLLWVAGYALLGMALAVVVRSVPVALAVGIAWAGPVEHLVQDAWDPASRLFPGLLLEAFVAGGTPQVSAARALLTVAVYTVAAVTVAGTIFTRRDVTA